MSRKPYNGWSAAERTASGGRARRRYASGDWTRPTECVACGSNSLLGDAERESNQRWGAQLMLRHGFPIFDHLEDYSTPAEIRARLDASGDDYRPDDPFDPERIPLCYRCHMAVHTRFNNLDSFITYRELVREGWRFPGLRANEWARFQREHLRGNHETIRIRARAVRNGGLEVDATFLDLLLPYPVDYKKLLAHGDGRPPSMNDLLPERAAERAALSLRQLGASAESMGSSLRAFGETLSDATRRLAQSVESGSAAARLPDGVTRALNNPTPAPLRREMLGGALS